MKISISVTNFSWPGGPDRLGPTLAAVARDAEAAGVDTLWVADHLLQLEPGTNPEDPMLEAYTTLGFLAAATERVRLGTLVTWASLRPAALLVKALSTLDVLSGGRAWFGVGAGYRDDEAVMTGVPFPPTGERFDRLAELLDLADHMWSGNPDAFHGRHEHLTAPINSPQPLARPRVLIGGSGEKRTLPLVARYADACNLFDIPDGGATVRRKLGVLREACEAIGRDPDDVEITLSSRLAPGESAEAFAERCAGIEGLGIRHVVLAGNGPWTGDALDVVGAAAGLLHG